MVPTDTGVTTIRGITEMGGTTVRITHTPGTGDTTPHITDTGGTTVHIVHITDTPDTGDTADALVDFLPLLPNPGGCAAGRDNLTPHTHRIAPRCDGKSNPGRGLCWAVC